MEEQSVNSTNILTTKRQYDINKVKEKKKKNKSEKLSDKKKIVREKKRVMVERKNNILETRTKFYFKINNNTYTVNIDAINLVEQFDNIYNNNPFNGTEEQPLIIGMNIDDDVLQFLLEYIEIWEDKSNDCNYPIQSNIQTRIIEQILKDQDLKIINKYLSKKIKINKTDSILSVIEQKISALSLLLNTFDVNYLHVPSICAKINAFISSLVWSCSLKEINEYLNNLDSNLKD